MRDHCVRVLGVEEAGVEMGRGLGHAIDRVRGRHRRFHALEHIQAALPGADPEAACLVFPQPAHRIVAETGRIVGIVRGSED